jgi:hypothetical protein
VALTRPSPPRNSHAVARFKYPLESIGICLMQIDNDASRDVCSNLAAVQLQLISSGGGWKTNHPITQRKTGSWSPSVPPYINQMLHFRSFQSLQRSQASTYERHDSMYGAQLAVRSHLGANQEGRQGKCDNAKSRA